MGRVIETMLLCLDEWWCSLVVSHTTICTSLLHCCLASSILPPVPKFILQHCSTTIVSVCVAIHSSLCTARSNLSLFFPLDPWQLPQARAEVAGQQAFLLYRAPPLDGTPFDINTEEDDTVCTRDVIVAVEYNGKQGDLGRFPTLHYASLTVLYKKWGFYYQLYEALTNILDTAQDPSPVRPCTPYPTTMCHWFETGLRAYLGRCQSIREGAPRDM